MYIHVSLHTRSHARTHTNIHTHICVCVCVCVCVCAVCISRACLCLFVVVFVNCLKDIIICRHYGCTKETHSFAKITCVTYNFLVNWLAFSRTARRAETQAHKVITPCCRCLHTRPLHIICHTPVLSLITNYLIRFQCKKLIRTLFL